MRHASHDSGPEDEEDGFFDHMESPQHKPGAAPAKPPSMLVPSGGQFSPGGKVIHTHVTVSNGVSE